MYSEEMESFGIFEDLSLFNGDLLLEDVSPVIAIPQGRKDEPSISEAVLSPTNESSVLTALVQPQDGSCQLGLQDLLTASPLQDLPDPFTASSAWFDTKTDLLDLLTGVEGLPRQQQEHATELTTDNPLPPSPVVAVHQQDPNNESLQAIQTLLLADLPIDNTPVNTNVKWSSSCVIDNPESPPSDADIDILEELNQAGLEQLLASAPDPNTVSLLDNSVFSPVSADDVDSLLSSNPVSPSEEPSLSSLFTSFSGSPAITIDNKDVEDLCASPQRPVREKNHTAPYTIRAPSTPNSGVRKAKVDRRERKKQQNRTAALRYRDKKRSEQDILQQECDELEVKNMALRDKMDSITREMKYLKDLMAEVQKERSKSKK